MTQQHEDLLNLLQSLCTKRTARRYIIDGLLNYKNWYIWFDAELYADDPKPGTCDIHTQKCGTATDDFNSGICIVVNANRYGVLRFLAAIGVNHLPEKARKAYYDANLVIKPMKTEPQE